MKKYKIHRLLILCFIITAVSATIYYRDELGIREIPLAVLQAKYEKPESRYISIHGTPVHYCDQGTGPVVIALHGIADSLHTWDQWTEKMVPHYRIVRMDIPGFGLTGPARDGIYTKDGFVGFLKTFMDALKIENGIIVGNSLGGAIAWNFALAYPEMVNQLVLIDPAGYPMEIPWPLNLAETPGIRHVAKWITPRWIFQMSLKQVFGDPSKVTDQIIDRFYELNLRPGNRGALIGIMDSLKKLNHDPAFSRNIADLSVPTLLIWGEKDIWIPVSHVSKWKQAVPGIQTILYENAGHVPQLEIPDQVAADMHQWIATHAAEKKNGPGWNAGMWIFISAGAGLLLLIALRMVRNHRNGKAVEPSFIK
ncbi:MAG: alpha/beta hydrolase [Desulfobacteraceae bacterium]|nr:MAG: alpha/beta hydrolase [Desulfobacteraceae bacterium]